MPAPHAADGPLRRLVDESEIRDVLFRYCRGVDRLDRDLVRSCYHADATDEHGSFAGSVDDYLDWSFRLLRRYSRTMHYLANVLVERAGDVARVESYGMAFHQTDDGGDFDPRGNLITGFRFIDRFERRAGVWRIAHRIATTEWSRVDDPAGRWDVPGHLRRGSRDADDPIWSLVPDVETGRDGDTA